MHQKVNVLFFLYMSGSLKKLKFDHSLVFFWALLVFYFFVKYVEDVACKYSHKKFDKKDEVI